MPSAKALLIQTAVIIGLGAAVGLGDLAYRGGKVRLGLEAPPPLPPAGSNDPKPQPPQPDPAADASNATDAGSVDPEPAQTTEQPVAAGTAPANTVPVVPAAGYDCTSMDPPAHWKPNHITLARAFDLYQSGQGVFVDARIEQDYLDGHIPGAHFLPVSAFEGDYPDRVKFQMDPNAITVVYCSGGDDCEAAEDVAIFLQGAGFTSLYIIHDGMPGWIACGHPVEHGEDPNAF